MSDKFYMTQEGYDKLKNELHYLRTTRRGEIAEKIKIARDFGDLSENAEYDEAKNEQGTLENRINQLEEQLQKAVLLDESKISADSVSLGSTVTIYDVEFDEEMTYKIVTSVEAHHSEVETISDESPVGKALLGHKVEDQVEAHLPSGGTATYKILNITR